MNMTTIPAYLRQLLVEAAAELEDLTDDGGYEVDEVRRLAGRLRDVAAGRPIVRTFLVEQESDGGYDLVEVCEFRVVGGQIEVATHEGWELTLLACGEPLDVEAAARDAAEWVADGDRTIYDPDKPVTVTESN